MQYGNDLDEGFQVHGFSAGLSLMRRYGYKPWQWRNCNLLFEKISDDIIRFRVKRNRKIKYDERKRLRSDGQQKSISEKLKSYKFHYIVHFDVPISSLPKTIKEEMIEKQLNDKGQYGDKKECWVLYLGNNHKIWTWKDNEMDTKNTMIRILESINEKANNLYITSVDRRDNKINKDILPVIYHCSAVPKNEPDFRQYIQEIHINRSTMDNKILVTIVFTDEQLISGWLDSIYRVFRKIRYGRTFDIESFSIVLDENGCPTKLDFTDIYSGHDKNFNNDRTHLKKFGVDIQHYFNQMITRPIIFVNTSNHAMAEIDTNNKRWKVEYRIWEQDCPVYVGTDTRCEVEKYLAKHGIEPLFHKCVDSRYFS